jgi:cytochrome c553
MGAIAGRPEAEIAAALATYRSGERPASVMTRIARGFSEEESRAIAAYWAGVRE